MIANRYLIKAVAFVMLGLSHLGWADYLEEDGPGGVFVCGDIRLSDHGISLDGPGYFYDVKSNKLLCKFAMVSVTCPESDKNEPCQCPPPAWHANQCSKKYTEYLRSHNGDMK